MLNGKIAKAHQMISWITHHHDQDLQLRRDTLDFYKLFDVLNVLLIFGPCTFVELHSKVHLISNKNALVKYLDRLQDLRFISSERRKMGGGFVSIRTAIFITEKGKAFVNLVEAR